MHFYSVRHLKVPPSETCAAAGPLIRPGGEAEEGKEVEVEVEQVGVEVEVEVRRQRR